MFTGIVEEVGTIAHFEGGGGARISVVCRKVLEGTLPGHSMAVDGVCLTVETVDKSSFACTLSMETAAITTLGGARQGRAVNLERALAAGDRMGGHFVTGHVQCQGRILTLRPEGRGRLLEVSFPELFAPFVLAKGAVAVDGVSLTMMTVSNSRFGVSLIPETFEKTTFRLKRPGDSVNLEPDLILKYVRSAVEKVHGLETESGKGLRALMKSESVPE